MSESVIITAAIGVVSIIVSVLVFLISRVIWCWYLKINARLEEQRKTNMYLAEISNLMRQSILLQTGGRARTTVGSGKSAASGDPAGRGSR